MLYQSLFFLLLQPHQFIGVCLFYTLYILEFNLISSVLFLFIYFLLRHPGWFVDCTLKLFESTFWEDLKEEKWDESS